MTESYTFKYLKSYAVQIISIVLGIVSLSIVIPFISSNKEVFGVYSICISTMVFLSYADLGFLGAANKYAAEFFQNKDKKSEIEVLAFGGFILFIVACTLCLFFLLLSIHPEFVITGIEKSPSYNTAESLFFWMAVFALFYPIQRVVQNIYNVRVEDYIFQFVNIIGSVIKILSVFYFFSGDKYEIVAYFIFIQIVSVCCSFVAFIIVAKRYDYDLWLLLKSFRWSKKCYYYTKDLALSSFALTIAWVLYYEIDQFALAKMYGAEQVAIFSIGFAILNYIRMFLGRLYSPFLARFAHFRAQNDVMGLKNFFIRIVDITFPIVVLPIFSLFILIRLFVYAWAGPQYDNAVPLAAILVLLNIFAYLSYTAGNIITVFEKTRTIRILAFILPSIYWMGILLLPKSWTFMSFGIMKVFVFWLEIPIDCYIAFKILNINWKTLFKGLIKKNYLAVATVMVLSVLAVFFMPLSDKGFLPLLMVCSVILIIAIIGYIITYFTNPVVKDYALNIIYKYKHRQ